MSPELFDLLMRKNSLTLIAGAAGVGKSSLMKQLEDQNAGSDRMLLRFDLQRKFVGGIADVYTDSARCGLGNGVLIIDGFDMLQTDGTEPCFNEFMRRELKSLKQWQMLEDAAAIVTCGLKEGFEPSIIDAPRLGCLSGSPFSDTIPDQVFALWSPALEDRRCLTLLKSRFGEGVGRSWIV